MSYFEITIFVSHFRVLGGIVLILLIVALSTCIKNRRNIMVVSTSGQEPVD